MKYLIIGLFFFLNSSISNAQIAFSSSDIVQYYPEKTKQIAAKIHQGFVVGKLKAYLNDSLNSSFTQEEVANNGAKQIVDDEGNVTGNTPINLDSVKLSLAFSYEIVSGKFGSITFKPIAISPTYETKFLEFAMWVPFGWAAWTDLQTILQQDEISFLNNLAQWYRVFPSVQMSPDYETAALINVENWLNTGSTQYVDPLEGEEYVGKAVLQNTKYKLFYAVNSQKSVLLNSKMEKVLYNDFMIAHTIETIIQMHDNGWNNWAEDDPRMLEDTVVMMIPYKFDSIGMEQIGGKTYWTIFQKTNSGEFLKYFIDYNQSKQNLPLPATNLLHFFIEDKLKK